MQQPAPAQPTVTAVTTRQEVIRLLGEKARAEEQAAELAGHGKVAKRWKLAADALMRLESNLNERLFARSDKLLVAFAQFAQAVEESRPAQGNSFAIESSFAALINSWRDTR